MLEIAIVPEPKWMAQALAAQIFCGMAAPEIDQVARCLGTHVKKFDRGDTLLPAGGESARVGLVLEGSAFAERVDHSGARHLTGSVGAGEIFGEELLGNDRYRTDFSVIAASPGRALIIGMEKIVHSAGPLCSLRSRVVENLFHIVAEKNRTLQRKLDVVETKSLRARIVLFLGEQQRMHGARQFTVPFSRADLADYLNADRTALSRELARMKAENLIDYYRNSFTVLGLPSTATGDLALR